MLSSSSRIHALLKKHYADAQTSLVYHTPMEMLVATILSAQCTDKQVNKVTKELFKTRNTPQDYARIPLSKLERAVKSTGFYENKARHIKGAAQAIMKQHGGKVPTSMSDLTQLPGVGRKTANVVVSNLTGKHQGIVVDTHVLRLSKRLGLTKHNQPEKVEQDLLKQIPKKDWMLFSNALIAHGRAVCTARKPLCGECFLNKLCPSAFKI